MAERHGWAGCEMIEIEGKAQETLQKAKECGSKPNRR